MSDCSNSKTFSDEDAYSARFPLFSSLVANRFGEKGGSLKALPGRGTVARVMRSAAEKARRYWSSKIARAFVALAG